MESFVLKQLEFARNQTLKALDGIPESMATRIPATFRNHILWQAGHIYLVQERFSFLLHGLDAQIPEPFMALFAPGTTPLAWTAAPPTLSEVTGMLRDQQRRIQHTFKDLEKTPAPYTTSSGMTMETTSEFLNFSLYHEGMHFSSIKHYKALLNS
ncbi:DinB family protein [Paenibacillus mesophilus]|uniref:DinB family protein n=1 Tax=Paenibacillus mesophilus TaxID=2582849 RepID=UPI00110D628B|nr:DinB family protein [Paenibacillus mesophilus]TMV43462.1 DinB family protein [Paenibacillus mesophilus]